MSKRNNAAERIGIGPIEPDSNTPYLEADDDLVDPESDEILARVEAIKAVADRYDAEAATRETGDSKGGSSFTGARPPRRVPLRNRK
jgi:hypothetical protein